MKPFKMKKWKPRNYHYFLVNGKEFWFGICDGMPFLGDFCASEEAPPR